MRMYDNGVRGLVIIGILFFMFMGWRAYMAAVQAEVAYQEAKRSAPSTPARASTPSATASESNALEPNTFATNKSVKSGDVLPAPVARQGPREKAWLALTGEHGWKWSYGQPFERTASFQVTSVDVDEWTFEGDGNWRARLPYKTVTFSGRVAEDGTSRIEFSNQNQVFAFGKPTASGGLAGRNTALEPLSEKEAQRLDAYDALIEAVVASTVVQIRTVPIENQDRGATLQRQPHRSEAGLWLGSTSTDSRHCNNMTDGDLSSAWYGGDCWIALRLREPKPAKGLAFLLSGYGEDRNVTLTINGNESVPLAFGRRGGMGIADFGTTIDVVDVQLEVFGRAISIQEVYFLD